MHSLLPTALDVVQRLRCLHTVIYLGTQLPPRDLLFTVMTDLSETEQQAMRAQLAAGPAALRGQLETAGIWPAMTPPERALVTTSPLDLDPQVIADAAWSLEAAVTLLWAFGIPEVLPRFDARSDPSALEVILEPSFYTRVKLRPSAEIDRARQTAELWHWRSRTRQLDELGTPLPPGLGFASLDEIVRTTAAAAAADGVLPAPIHGDFPARGVAYRSLSPEDWGEVASIARERHHGLNWLCGRAPDHRWELTPTGT
jgi:Domain of unknown function (DUF4272)